MMMQSVPEYENEEHQKGEEHGHVVHGPQHDHQLSAEVGQKPHQFQYTQQSKGPQHRNATALDLYAMEDTIVDLERAQNHDEAVKDIEAITDVSKEAIGRQLQQHLDGENDAEHEVADLDSLGQQLRLAVELDAHAEGVGEDAEEDEPLEPVVIHEQLQMVLHPGEERSEPATHGPEPFPLVRRHDGRLVGVSQVVDALDHVFVHGLGKVVG